MTFVQPHTHQEFVIRMDLKDFFLSISASRIHALFAAMGYAEPVARILAGLCTNSVPHQFMRPGEGERDDAILRQRLRTPHLPQGAPTSPALANLCAFKLDCRLQGLAKRFEWQYTRYADDMLFSGELRHAELLKQFQIWIGAIALEEGFEVNFRKSRIMRRGTRQSAGGLVLNVKPNVARGEFDTLKATIHNCVRFGPASQNREQHTDFRAHLLGRISHIRNVNPIRGERLRKLFDRIQWAV